MSFLARRLGFVLIAAWAGVTLNFLLPRLIPGDPATVMLTSYRGSVGADQVAAMRKSFGLDGRPLWDQYWTYLSHIFHGDFGRSLSQYPAAVTSVIGTGLRWTVLLGLTSLVIGFVLGTILGAIAASRQGGFLDSVVPPFALFVGSFPYFFFALALLWFVGYKTGWMPTGHAYDDSLVPSYSWKFVGSVGRHLVLPATTIVVVSIGGWILAMRNTMIGVLSEDYLVMAEAKGLPPRRVLWRYAARNALLPSVSSLGLAIGFIFAGQILTEMVFSYPGIGYQLLLAVNNLDYPLMQALFLLITAGVLIANLLVDVALMFLDPRIRDTQLRAA